MFGHEQYAVQSKVPLKLLYRLIGEYRYPLRLRGFFLSRILPKGLSPKAIWDAGCGIGQTSFFLARRFPNAPILGTDLVVSRVEHCGNIQQTNPRYKHVEFEIGNLLEVNCSEDYDLVVCFEVLEHIEDYDQAVDILSNSLRPGGMLVIHTPADGKFQTSNLGLRRFAKSDESPTSNDVGQYHVRPGFDLSDLADCLERHGLKVESKRYTFGYLAMLAHTVYERTRSRSLFMVLTFPLLILAGLIDWYLPKNAGGGILILAKKA